jgi:hypothetical protein
MRKRLFVVFFYEYKHSLEVKKSYQNPDLFFTGFGISKQNMIQR